MIDYYLFMAFWWLTLSYVLWMPATWLLMGVITPKSLMDRYFKEPHFTLGETIWLKQFPGSLIRTVIFCALIFHPYRGRRRQMTDIRDHAPRWFVITSEIFFVAVLAQGILVLGLLIAFLIYVKFIDP